MSAEIKSAETQRRMRLDRISADSDHILVLLDDGHLRPNTRFMAEIRPTRADFLAAVAAECGVIVIDRAILPPATVDREWIEVDGQTFGTTEYHRDGARRNALRYIAAVDYLDAHPPVDEAKVEALADDLKASRPDPLQAVSWDDMARRLIAAGWSK